MIEYERLWKTSLFPLINDLTFSTNIFVLTTFHLKHELANHLKSICQQDDVESKTIPGIPLLDKINYHVKYR